MSKLNENLDECPGRPVHIRLSNGQICYGSQYGESDDAPVGIFVHGFRSSTRGTKATSLKAHALNANRNWIEFDLPCHGRSDGIFRSFRIRYAVEALVKVIQLCGDRPIILIGSSLGGWLATAAAICLDTISLHKGAKGVKPNITGALLIAPAFDFVEYYFANNKVNMDMWTYTGLMEFKDAYDGNAFNLDIGVIEDSKNHSVLSGSLELRFPIQIYHGDHDEIVPVELSHAFRDSVSCPRLELDVIPGGDHSLNDHLAQFCVGLDRLFDKSITN